MHTMQHSVQSMSWHSLDSIRIQAQQGTLLHMVKLYMVRAACKIPSVLPTERAIKGDLTALGFLKLDAA
jgi:hypothetical protein